MGKKFNNIGYDRCDQKRSFRDRFLWDMYGLVGFFYQKSDECQRSDREDLTYEAGYGCYFSISTCRNGYRFLRVALRLGLKPI
jgi:hypothetical protein